MKKIPVRHLSAVQQEAVSAGQFRIRDLQQILGGNELIHELHRHNFFFILVIDKGSGTHEIDFRPYQVHNHSVFILRPGQVHQLYLHESCTGFLLEFDPAFYSPKDKTSHQRLVRAGNKNFCTLENPGFARLYDALAYMLHEFSNRQEGYLDIIKANLDIFFIEFNRQSRNPQSALQSTHSYAQERLEDFHELLETHISTLKQVSQYADLLNLSGYQLNAITRTLLGKAASEVINEHIILEAKRYLLATPNQVKDIADHLGYDDISYFIRFFRKHTGHSPEAFRKNSR